MTDLSHMLLEPGSLPLLLDLNDANQTFEVLHGHSIAELQYASATVIPAKPKVSRSSSLANDFLMFGVALAFHRLAVRLQN